MIRLGISLILLIRAHIIKLLLIDRVIKIRLLHYSINSVATEGATDWNGRDRCTDKLSAVVISSNTAAINAHNIEAAVVVEAEFDVSLLSRGSNAGDLWDPLLNINLRGSDHADRHLALYHWRTDMLVWLRRRRV